MIAEILPIFLWIVRGGGLEKFFPELNPSSAFLVRCRICAKVKTW